MNVNDLAEFQINAELLARHSRTSGGLQQKRDRLQRFLDFEDQKKRRNEYVERLKAETDWQDDNDCPYLNEIFTVDESDVRAANILQDLRDDTKRSEYYINHLIPRVKALEDIVASMEKRIADLELADMPGLISIPESNPNWVHDDSRSPYAWECTKLN
jgi:uncharacterized protein YceH (UPF0502 family)